MAQNDFLEGVRKGMMAYMQTRNMMQQYEGNQLQMEGQQLQMETERMKQDAYKRSMNAPAPATEAAPQKPQKWVPQSMDEAIEYEERRAKALAPYRNAGRGGSGGAKEKEPKEPGLKDIVAAREESDKIMARYGIVSEDKDNPDMSLEPVRDKIAAKMLSEGYYAAVGFARFYQRANSGQFPELNDPALDSPMQIQGEGGKVVEVDPQAYLEMIASQPGVSDAQIDAEIARVIAYYGNQGLLQNPTERWIHGVKPVPLEISHPNVNSAVKGMQSQYSNPSTARFR